jgi:anaerobic selenocysteine-containing dehydrogenase
MNRDDLAALGLRPGDAVSVFATGGADAERRLDDFVAVDYPIARGSCAAYYPEAMPLVALEDHDPASFTPAYKSIWVRVERRRGRPPR